MAVELPNVRIRDRADVPVGGVIFEFFAGEERSVTEHIADRLVAAGKAERIIPKGGRLAAAEAVNNGKTE